MTETEKKYLGLNLTAIKYTVCGALALLIFFTCNAINENAPKPPMDYLLVDVSPSLPDERFTAIKNNIGHIVEKFSAERSLTIMGLQDGPNGNSNKIKIQLKPMADTNAARAEARRIATQNWSTKKDQLFNSKPKTSPIYETLEDILLDTDFDEQKSRIFIISDMIQISPNLNLLYPQNNNNDFSSLFSKLPKGQRRIFLVYFPYDFVQNTDSTQAQREAAIRTFLDKLSAQKSGPLFRCNSWLEFAKYITED